MNEEEFFYVSHGQYSDLRVLYSEEQIREKAREIAAEIEDFFPSDEPLYIVCVLKGGMLFCSDLIRCLKTPVQLEFVKVSSYGNEFHTKGDVKIIGDLPDVDNQNVLLVDDIVDTGYTANYLLDMFKTQFTPKRIKTAVLINKLNNRRININPDFYGFDVDEEYLVGYGLDYVGFYRNLPYVGCFPKNTVNFGK